MQGEGHDKFWGATWHNGKFEEFLVKYLRLMQIIFIEFVAIDYLNR